MLRGIGAHHGLPQLLRHLVPTQIVTGHCGAIGCRTMAGITRIEVAVVHSERSARDIHHVGYQLLYYLGGSHLHCGRVFPLCHLVFYFNRLLGLGLRFHLSLYPFLGLGGCLGFSLGGMLSLVLWLLHLSLLSDNALRIHTDGPCQCQHDENTLFHTCFKL